MAGIGIFDTRKQLTFYGAYHSNPINVGIHMCCIPLLVWSFEVLIAPLPKPDFLPSIHYEFSKNFVFDLNWSALWISSYIIYYLILDPVAAILYLPQTIVTLLHATAFAARPDALKIGGAVHALSWIMQFIGHNIAEKRAPALLDNFWGAMFTAPFFAHLEILFKLGCRPQLHHDIKNSVDVEIARIRREEAEKKRAKNQ